MLLRTLSSVHNQSLRPLNVILVDNASSDNSRKLLTEWAESVDAPDFRVSVIDEPRLGATFARNAGLQRVDSPWVMFFDSDDEMLPNHCADFHDAIIADPSLQLVGRPVSSVREDGSSGKPGQFAVRNMMTLHIFHSILATQRWCARTDLVRQVGAWNNKVIGWDDYELGIRLLIAKPKTKKIADNSAVRVHLHPDSITGSCFSHSPAKWEDTLDVCSQNLENSEFKRYLPYIDCVRAILAANYFREGAFSEARRLLANTLKGKSRLYRLKIKAVYLHQRCLRRGANLSARLLFHI